MLGLMQDWPLLCHRIIDHAAKFHGARKVVTRSIEGPIVETNYAEIRARALKVAQRLRGTASNAVTSAKELLQQAPGNTLDQQLAAERDAFVDALFHPNAAEGMAAFFDKRPARFH